MRKGWFILGLFLAWIGTLPGCVLVGANGGTVVVEAFDVAEAYEPPASEKQFVDPPPEMLRPASGVVFIQFYKHLIQRKEPSSEEKYEVLRCVRLDTQGQRITYPPRLFAAVATSKLDVHETGMRNMGVLALAPGRRPVMLATDDPYAPCRGRFASKFEEIPGYKCPPGVKAIARIMFCPRALAKRPAREDNEGLPFSPETWRRIRAAEADMGSHPDLFLRQAGKPLIRAVEAARLSDAERLMVYGQLLQLAKEDTGWDHSGWSQDLQKTIQTLSNPASHARSLPAH